MVSSLCRAHLLTLTLVLVFFPLRIYMESVVCLCSVLWGVSVPLFRKRHQPWPEGKHDCLNMIEMVIFCSLPLSLTLALICFLLMEHLIIRHKKRKVTHMPSLSLEKCCQRFLLSVILFILQRIHHFSIFHICF